MIEMCNLNCSSPLIFEIVFAKKFQKTVLKQFAGCVEVVASLKGISKQNSLRLNYSRSDASCILFEIAAAPRSMQKIFFA